MKSIREAMFRIAVVVLAFLGLAVSAMFGRSSGDSLENGFKAPPNSAKPPVWWHWMNGNITKEGIKLDLDHRGSATGRGEDLDVHFAEVL